MNYIEGNSYTYELILCKTNREKIGFIKFSSISFTQNLKATEGNSLDFTMQKFLYNLDKEENYINPMWKLVKENMLILLNIYNGTAVAHQEYFSVNTPAFETNNGTDEKNISCISEHIYLFKRKKIRGYDDTRKLIDFKTDANGNIIPVKYDTSDYMIGGILNYVIDKVFYNNDLNKSTAAFTNYTTNSSNNDVWREDSWRVDYYDPKLDELYEISINETEILNICDILLSWREKRDEHLLSIQSEIYELLDNTNADYSTKMSLFDATEGSTGGSFQAMLYTLDDIINWGELSSRKQELLNNPYYGTKILSKSEEYIAYTQQVIDKIIALNSSSKNSDLKSDILDQLLNIFYQQFIDEVYNTLLIFQGYAGGRPYRTLKFSETDIITLLEELESSYQCVFKINNYNKTIKIYSKDNPLLNVNNGLIVSPDNYMINMTYTPNTENHCTRLYLKGKNDINIINANPMGEKYCDNFTSYMNTDYMSEQLISALNYHQNEINKTGNFNFVFSDETTINYTSYIDLINNIHNQLQKANKEYVVYKDYYDKAVYADNQYKDIDSQINKETDEDKKKILTNEFNAVEEELDYYKVLALNENGEPKADIIQKEIDSLHSKLSQIYNKLSYKTLFQEYLTNNSSNTITEDDLLNELSLFITEDDLTIDSVTDERALYQYGIEYLKNINIVPCEFNIDLVDVLTDYTNINSWNKVIATGNKVYVHYPNFNFNYDEFQITKISHSITDNTSDLQLTLSNSEKLESNNFNLINKIWRNNYLLTKDINSFKSSWQEYLTDRKELIRQGEDINTSINQIRNKAGNVIINAQGIVPSRAADNILRANADGGYVSTLDILKAVEESGISAGGVDNGLNIYENIYSYDDSFMQRKYIGTRNINTETGVVTGSSAEERIIYYQEIYNNEFRWYKAVLSAELEVYTDRSGALLYWSDIKNPDPSKNYKFKTSICPALSEGETEEDYKIWVYKIKEKILINITKIAEVGTDDKGNVVKAPVTYLGAGITGEEDALSGKGIIRKETDGFTLGYHSRVASDENDKTKDTIERERGIYITDQGVYQIRGNVKSKLPMIFVQNEQPDYSIAEDGDIWFKTMQEV